MTVMLPPAPKGSAARTAAGLAGIDVVDKEYGAVDDGLRSYFAVTATINQTSLGIQTYRGNVTVSNTGPGGVALVTMTGTGSQLVPGFNIRGDGSDSWANKPIAITGAGTAGATLVAKVSRVYQDFSSFGMVAQLDRAAPTPLSSAAQKVACPCFTDGTVSPFNNVTGFPIWLSQGGVAKSVANGNSNLNSPFFPLKTTIAAVTDPFTITMGTAWKASTASASWQGCLVMWGTDNRAAIIAASQAAQNINRRAILFPGGTKSKSTGLFIAFDWQTENGPGVAQSDFDAATAAGRTLWISDGAETAVVSKADTNSVPFDILCRRQAVPVNAPEPGPPARTASARLQFPGCAGKNTIVACITGDSWGTPDPTGGAGNSSWVPLKEAIEAANPGKTFIWVNRARGGSTWRMLSDPAALGNLGFSWITDVSKPWSFYIQNCVTSIGTVTPDLILVLSHGNNDSAGLTTSEVEAFLQLVAGWATSNGMPPDVLMAAGPWKDMATTTAGQLEYGPLEDEYGTRLTRNIARYKGKAYVDYAPRGGLVGDGWSPDHLALKQMPPPGAGTASATSPYQLGPLCRDFYAAIMLGSSAQSGATIWGNTGTLRVRLSSRPDNQAVVGVDGSGNLNVEIRAWGGVVNTPVSITSGTAALSTSGQSDVDLSTASIAPIFPAFSLGAGNAAFTTGQVGQCIQAQLSSGGYTLNGAVAPYRSVIYARLSATVILTCDCLDNAGPGQGLGHGNLVGGWSFVQRDADARVDVIVPGAGAATHPFLGASCLISKVAAYGSATSVTLNDKASATLAAASKSMFLGRIVQPATYNFAVAAGTDNAGAAAGQQPVLIIRVKNGRVAIGYLLGSLGTSGDIRALIAVKDNLRWIYEGDTGGAGGPFVPQVWTDSVGGVPVQCVYLAIGERVLHKPSLTAWEMWGLNDIGGTDYPFSGDTSHPSLLWHEHVFRPVVNAQDWTFGAAAEAGSFTVTTKTANYAVTAADRGTFFNNSGAAAEVDFTLPAAAPGLQYSFTVDAAQILKVIAAGTDKIAVGASNSVAGGNASASAVFATLTIYCEKAGQWVARSSTGTWTVT